MNRFFLLIISLSAVTSSLAQTSVRNRQTDLLGKGTLNAGVQLGGGYQYSSGLTGRFVPRLHYVVKDGWSVGLEGRYQKSGNQARYVGAGLSTRYYFVRFKPFAVYGQAGATVGQSRNRAYAQGEGDPLFINRREQKAKAWQATAGLGAHFRVSNRWALEVTAERTLTNSRDAFKNYSRWQGSAGASYQLKRK